MRGLPPSLPLTVSERQRSILEKEHRKTTIPFSYNQRISIILSGIEGKSIHETHRDLGISLNTVRKWRRRWESEQERLRAMEEDEQGRPIKDYLLGSHINGLLSDKPRSGAPKRISLAQEQQIVSLACEDPEKHGIPMDYWTREMLAHVAKATKIVDRISPRYISTILKKTN